MVKVLRSPVVMAVMVAVVVDERMFRCESSATAESH